MSNARQNNFNKILQELGYTDTNNTKKSVLLEKIEQYSTNPDAPSPQYDPHCNIHRMHQSFNKVANPNNQESFLNEDGNQKLLGADQIWNCTED